MAFGDNMVPVNRTRTMDRIDAVVTFRNIRQFASFDCAVLRV